MTRGDLADDVELGQGLDGRRQRRVGRGVGDDDEVGPVAPSVVAPAMSCWRTVSIETSCSANAAATWASTPGRSATSRLMWYRVSAWPIGEDRQVGVGRLPRPAAAADAVAGDGDDVAEHGAGGGVAAGALAVEHQLAGGVGLDEHRVEGLADAGQRVASAGSSPGAPGPDTRGSRRRRPTVRSQIASSLTTQPISRGRRRRRRRSPR